MKKRIILPVLAASCLGYTSGVSAQTKTIIDDTQNTVFITGGRTEVVPPPSNSTYTFTQGDIERASGESLPQLLSQIPGIAIDHNGGPGAATRINIRGTESDHVLVLIDGVRVSSASLGTAAIQHIPLSQIERIEVVKGPKSGIYGADALGGVIQIFTRKGKNNTGGFVEVGAGSNNADTLAAGFNGGVGDYYYGVNLGREETDGIDRKRNTTGADTDQDAYDQNNFSINLGRDSVNGLDLDVLYLVNQGTTRFDSRNADDSTDFRLETVNVSSSYPITPSLSANLNVGFFKDDQRTYGSNVSRFTTRRQSTSTFLTYTDHESQSFVFGYDYYEDRVGSTSNFIESNRDNAAFFSEYALTYDDIELQLAGRRDRNEAYGVNESASIAIGVSVSSNQKLTLSYGRAFKAPTYNDLFFPFTDFGGGFTYQGNPNLKPEKSDTVEIAYAATVSEYQLGMSFYRTEIEELIQLTSSFDTVENIADAELLGAEFSLARDYGDFDWGLTLEHVDARNTANEQRLNRRPRGTMTLYANQQLDELDLSIRWYVEDGRRQSATNTTGGYGLVDVGANYRLTRKDMLSLRINNVFDRDYLLVDGTTTFNTEGQTIEAAYRHLF